MSPVVCEFDKAESYPRNRFDFIHLNMGDVMKKILFATTTLIATASVAAADVNFNGFGRFGVGYKEDRSADPDADPEVSDTILVSRFRMNINASTETDNGTKFEARVRMQADKDANTGEANAAGLNGPIFSVSYGGLRVDAGNVSGAFDNLNGYYGNEPGLENFIGQYSGVNYGFLGYSSGAAGDNAVFINYAVGDFAFGASYDKRNTDGDRWDISTTYSFGDITAALAYGQTDGVGGAEKQSLTVLTLAGEWGDFSGALLVAKDDVSADANNGTAYGLSGAYKVGGATTLTFAYGDGSADDDKQQLGIGLIYDLGGGASLRGGFGRSKVGNADGVVGADFGAQFNF